MNEPSTALPPISDRSGVNDAVRIQILATEHYSLLATRSITWTEVFSRASMFVTLLSASVVVLALVAQATGFGPRFRLFALLLLPVVLVMGLATFTRLGEANADDFGLVIGMNRLRRAYLELAPELESYFITGHHDDQASIMQTYGMGYRSGIGRLLGATPALVGSINVMLVGAITALLAEAVGVSSTTTIVIGVVAALVAVLGHVMLVYRGITGTRSGYRPRFPSE